MMWSKPVGVSVVSGSGRGVEQFGDFAGPQVRLGPRIGKSSVQRRCEDRMHGALLVTDVLTGGCGDHGLHHGRLGSRRGPSEGPRP